MDGEKMTNTERAEKVFRKHWMFPDSTTRPIKHPQALEFIKDIAAEIEAAERDAVAKIDPDFDESFRQRFQPQAGEKNCGCLCCDARLHTCCEINYEAQPL